MINGMELIGGFVGMIVVFCLWLEYRHLCNLETRRNNPYELIDLQKEIREQREKEDG